MDYPSTMMPRSLSLKIFTPLLILFLAAGFAGGFLLRGSTPATVTETVVRTHHETVTTSLVKVEVTPQTVTLSATTTQTVIKQSEEPPVKYAKFFGLTRGDSYVLLRDSHNRTVLAVPRGMPVPAIKADVIVRTPVERAVLMSATHVALVERLREFDPELWKKVVGIMWGQSYEWYFPEVERLLKSGVIKDVGASWSPDYEQIVALNPDLVIIYTYPGDPVASKLEELKIPYVVNNEYMENHPLGRFEWIKFVGVFFGLGKEADMVFKFVEHSYWMTAERVNNLVKKMGVPTPKVVWFSVFRGTVYVAGGKSYVAESLRHLGAVYAFGDLDKTGSATVTVEELVRRASDADVLIISTNLITSKQDLLKEIPQLAESKAFRQNRLYRYNSNIFQLGYYAAEELFRELAATLYPGYLSYHEPYDFFVKLS
ncbi:MAG: ABC transporter substrate-binding protein [Candidatus Caldarchaeum sp.]